MNRMKQICDEIRDGEEQETLKRNVRWDANITLGFAIVGGFLVGVAFAIPVAWVAGIPIGLGIFFIAASFNSIVKHELSSKYQDRTYFKKCLGEARNLQELEIAGMDFFLHPDLYAKLEDDQ